MKVTMVGGLSSCYLLTYETTPARLAEHLPVGLSPQVQNGRAHWGIVLSIVDKMRPKHSPRWTGSTYTHLALRAYVEATDAKGSKHEGLYFLRSDVNSKLMALGGNVMTDFKFNASKISWREDDAGLDVELRTKDERRDAVVVLRADWKADLMRDHLAYEPWGLSPTRSGRKLRLAEVRRDETRWKETPMRVEKAEWQHLAELDPRARLVSATRVSPLPYEWRIGQTVRLA